jgi:hypothetical protein
MGLTANGKGNRADSTPSNLLYLPLVKRRTERFRLARFLEQSKALALFRD